jgi:uncharacterized YigZ family protein
VSSDLYLTIEVSSTAEYKEKGSKFFAFSFPVEDESQIKELLNEFRKKYYDARHVCYAYILGTENRIMKGNDDGEPSHTAGTPILNQIRSKNLTNVLVIVVRYFGGTKLGVSGLIEAYKESAKACLDQAIIVERFVYQTITVKFQAIIQGEVMRFIKEFEANILSMDYDNGIVMIVQIRKSRTNAFVTKPILGMEISIIEV